MSFILFRATKNALQHLSHHNSIFWCSKDIKKENPPKREDFLKNALLDAQQSLNNAYAGMQNTNDPDLIDRYIYEWKAASLRYKVLLEDVRSIPDCKIRPALLTISDSRNILGYRKYQDSSANISSTNRETDTSLLNRSFK